MYVSQTIAVAGTLSTACQKMKGMRPFAVKPNQPCYIFPRMLNLEVHIIVFCKELLDNIH